MQTLLNDCHKVYRKTAPITIKKPFQTIRKLYHANEIKEKISEIKENILRAETEFQVS